MAGAVRRQLRTKDIDWDYTSNRKAARAQGGADERSRKLQNARGMGSANVLPMLRKVMIRLAPLVVVFALLALLPGVAQGQGYGGGSPKLLEDSIAEPVSCWTSGIHSATDRDGPFEDHMPWASDPTPILGAFDEGVYLLRHKAMENMGWEVPGGRGMSTISGLDNVWYYDSLAALADGAFYAPFEQSQKYDNNEAFDADGRTVYRKEPGVGVSPWVVDKDVGPDDPLAWKEYGKFIRSTSRVMGLDDGVVNFSAFWQSPGNAGGGGGADELARMDLANSYAANLGASSQEQMIGGNRVITELRQVPISNPTGVIKLDCNSGSCNQTFTQQVEIVSVAARADAINTNNAEYLNTTYERNQRNITGFSREGQMGHTFVDAQTPGYFDPKVLDPSDPYKGNEPDTGSDRIGIVIELNDEYRKDFKHDYGLLLSQTGTTHSKGREAVLSRFKDGDELLRVLDDIRIDLKNAPPFVQAAGMPSVPAVPDVNPGYSPILVQDDYVDEASGEEVDFGWVDVTSERVTGVSHVAVHNNWTLEGLFNGPGWSESHVGYRTSWLTSGRYNKDFADDRRAVGYKPWRDSTIPEDEEEAAAYLAAHKDYLDHYDEDAYLEYYDKLEGVLQWPVNFSDMAWYLFDIEPDLTGPQSYPGDFDALKRHKIFGPVVAVSGYTTNALPVSGLVLCEDHITTASTPDAGVTEIPECKNTAGTDVSGEMALDGGGKNWSEMLYRFRAGEVGGDMPNGIFPFEDGHAIAGSHFKYEEGEGGHLGRNLQSSWLIMQGVESPEDSVKRGYNTNSTFKFDIVDKAWFGAESAFSRGREALIQHGFPPDFQEDGADDETRHAGLRMMGRYQREAGIGEEGSLDPNKPYLLVLTFYQVKKDSDKGFLMSQPEDWRGAMGRVPGYQVRRVICRAWINSKLDEHSRQLKSGLWQDIKGILGDASKSVFEALRGMLTSVLQLLYRAQFQLAKSASGAVCSGMQVMDSWAVGRNVQDSFRAKTDDRAILLDPAVVANKEGLGKCKTLQKPDVRVCDLSVWDVAFKGRCRNLPKYELTVKRMSVKDPADAFSTDEVTRQEFHAVYDPAFGASGVPVSKTVVFKKVNKSVASFNTVTGGRRISRWSDRHAAGLTEFQVEWDVVDETIEEGINQLVNGFVVYMLPDSKVLTHGADLGQYAEFRLPRRVIYVTCDTFKTWDDAPGTPEFRTGEMSGFRVGALGFTEDHPNYAANECGTRTPHAGTVVKGKGISVVYYPSMPYGVDSSKWDLVVDAMPVAPGYQHTFVVAGYHGVPGTPGFRVGPPSEELTLHGDHSACLWLHTLTGPSVSREDIIELYGCHASSIGQAEVHTADDAPVYRLLSPIGSDLCHDLFTATPAHLTWNNPVVKQLWTLMWVLSGLVLLALLLWQGIRMTYDMWLDPQPSVGLRELVPRLLLAVVLAASSLWICQVVLVLASDLTCFVAQATGTTMWSLVANTVTSVMEAFFSWEDNLSLNDKKDLSDILMSWLKLIVVVFVILVFLILFIIVFVKVCIMMLIRLVTLAALIVFAPLAFTFYASDSTAHWTKLWVRMFLGTTFVQAVVLIVLYMGVNLMTSALSFGGVVDVTVEEKGLSDLIVGILIAFLTFGLADSVPKIINRDGQGLTDSVRGMGRMAVGGAALAAGTVAGIATGGAGFALQSGMGMARGASGGWSGGDGDDGGQGAGGGGGGRPSSPPETPLAALSSARPPQSSNDPTPGGSDAPSGSSGGGVPNQRGDIPGAGDQSGGEGGRSSPGGGEQSGGEGGRTAQGGGEQAGGEGGGGQSGGVAGQSEGQQRSFGQRLGAAAAGAGLAAPGVAAASRARSWMRGSQDPDTGRTTPSVGQRFANAINRMPSGPVAGARAGFNRGRGVNRFIEDVRQGSVLRGRQRDEAYGRPVTQDSASRLARAEEGARVERHEQMMTMMEQVAGGGQQNQASQGTAGNHVPPPPLPETSSGGRSYRQGPSGLFVPPSS